MFRSHFHRYHPVRGGDERDVPQLRGAITVIGALLLTTFAHEIALEIQLDRSRLPARAGQRRDCGSEVIARSGRSDSVFGSEVWSSAERQESVPTSPISAA